MLFCQHFLFIYNDIKIGIGEGSSKYIAHITETPHGLQKANIVYRYKSTAPYEVLETDSNNSFPVIISGWHVVSSSHPPYTCSVQ